MSRFVRTFKARKIFLDRLAVGDSISRAATLAGGTTKNFKKWRAEDENFAEDWDEAIEAGTDHLEDEVYSRALKKSDPLAMFMLKARRPEKFDRSSGKGVEVNINVEGSKQKLLNKIAKLQAAGTLPTAGGEEVKEISSDKTAAQPLALPAPSADLSRGRGSKRRAVEPGNRREAAS